MCLLRELSEQAFLKYYFPFFVFSATATDFNSLMHSKVLSQVVSSELYCLLMQEPSKLTELCNKLMFPLFQTGRGCWQRVRNAECPALHLTYQPACTNQVGEH